MLIQISYLEFSAIFYFRICRCKAFLWVFFCVRKLKVSTFKWFCFRSILFVCLFVLYSKFESTKMHVLYLRKKFKWKLIVFIVCKELIIFFKIDTENHQLMLYFVDYSYLYQHFMQYWYVIESMINCCHSILYFLKL